MRAQSTEDRGQKSEDSNQKSDIRQKNFEEWVERKFARLSIFASPFSVFCSLTSERSGVILVVTVIIMILLTAIVAAFLYMTSIQTLNIGYDIPDSQALWLAEAGMQKAIWNLKTPTGSGGQGENWTTSGTSASLGSGSYNMVVARWDFCLATNGSSASDSPAQTNSTIGPAKAIDGNNSTYWQSLRQPDSGDPQDLIIAFPYPLTINKVRFLASGSLDNSPEKYTWAVSTNGTTYTTVVNVSNNESMDVTNTFSSQSSVNFLRLRATDAGARIRIATLEAIGSKITSTGTVSTLNRQVERKVVADDATQTAFDEIDWTEL